MSIREPLITGEFYHLYNRGADKRKIFTSKNDYERFVSILYLSNNTKNIRFENIQRGKRGQALLTKVFEVERDEALVSIASYCLMPNHFHLLVRQNMDGGITRFMQKLITAYTMYFNSKHERNGVLFQGKFKSKFVQDDSYLKYLLAYINLNPYKFTQPGKYTYSSFLDFTGEKRLENKLLDTNVLPKYFPKPEDFVKEMQEWLNYRVEQGQALLT